MLFLLFVLAAILAAPVRADAQLFGKNQVMWRDLTWTGVKSEHYDFLVTLDLDDAHSMATLQNIADHLEGSYVFLSGALKHEFKRRPIIIVTGTHSEFETMRLTGGEYMPEGVGAYVLPRGSRWTNNQDLVMVVKPDFLPPLNWTILTHESGHLFQLSLIGWKFFIEPGMSVEPWLFEASAEYLAGLYAPYTRDDIRRRGQRIAAARTGDPDFGMPTLDELRTGRADPYGKGAMVFLFLEHRFGRERVLALIRDIFGRYEDTRFRESVMDLSEGEYRTAEDIDRANRNYWASVYAVDSLKRPKPYETTANFSGQEVVPMSPFPATSGIPRPSGMATYMTAHPKYGLVIASAPSPVRDAPPYVPDPNHRRRSLDERKSLMLRQRVLTPFMPPKHHETMIGQNWNVWPFNGWDSAVHEDASWAADVRAAIADVTARQHALDLAKATYPRKERGLKGEAKKDHKARTKTYEKDVQVAKKALADAKKALAKLRSKSGVSRVAYFGRRNRDHALFVIDGNTGTFLYTVEFKDLDQAFSPAFSSDGETVYFSAAHKTLRSLYALRLAPNAVAQRMATTGEFPTAPAVSPDGTKLAYVAFVGDYQKLFLLDLATGANRQLTWGEYNDNAPAWNHDGTVLALTSDERDGIWNLWTLDLPTGALRQWTEFYGGAYTCAFMPGENDRVMCSVLMEDDQMKDRVYPNLKLFTIRIGVPLTARTVVQTDDDMRIASAVSKLPAPPPQTLQRMRKVPQGWKLYGNDVYALGSTNSGFAFVLKTDVQNTLATKRFDFFGVHSRHLKIARFGYTNAAHRLEWSAEGFYTKYPLVLELFGMGGQLPSHQEPFGGLTNGQLNWTRRTELGIQGGAKKSFNRFNSIYIGGRIMEQTYDLNYNLLPDGDPLLEDPLIRESQRIGAFLRDSDRRFFGFNVVYRHDSLVYKYETMGPFNGFVANLHGEYAEPIGDKGLGFISGTADLRWYKALTPDVVFAVRGDFIYSTRANGEAMFLGGADTLRRYPYFSIIGNRAAYGSAELRFPIGDIVILKWIPFPVRGFIFGDVARVKLVSDSQPEQPAQDEWSYGFGLQIWALMPLQIECAKTRYEPGMRWNFRIGLGW
jgi:hypothetical protein